MPKKKKSKRLARRKPKRKVKRSPKFPLINKLSRRQEKKFLAVWDRLLAAEIEKTRKRRLAQPKRKTKKRKKRRTLKQRQKYQEEVFDQLLKKELEQTETRKQNARKARRVVKKFKSRPGEMVYKFFPPLKNPDEEFIPHLFDRAELNRWPINKPVRLRVLMTWRRVDTNETRYKIFHYYAENFAALLEYLVFRKKDFSDQFARSSLPRESVRETLRFEEVAIKNKAVSSYGILFEK